MIRLTSMVLGSALLIGAASGAYADPLQQPGASPVPQVSALPQMQMEPKPSGGANTESTHFVKPPGYDQDRSNFPYSSGQKPS